MIAYFAIGVVLLALLLLAGRWFGNANPGGLARAARVLAIAIGVIGIVYMVVAGRIGLASLIFGGLLPLLIRWRAMARAMRNAQGPAPGLQSEVDTRYLRMRLDHDTGLMSGTVVEGAHRGRELGELSTAELVELLRTCRVEDPDAAALLESYLNRTDENWRAGDQEAQSGERPGGSDPLMSREEAYRILGLEQGAGRDQVKQAHRDLMQKVHPDRGGSSYLAAKINEAKDLLLRT